VIPAKDAAGSVKPFTPEVFKMLAENKIAVLTRPDDMGKVVNQNAFVAFSNGVGNDQIEGAPTYGKSTVRDLKAIGLANTVAVPMYNRTDLLLKGLEKIGAPSSVMMLAQNILHDGIGMDGSEMKMNISVQRDKITQNLLVQIDKKIEKNELGPAPFTILIGFSGGAQPSVKVGSYLGNKASVINLDGPVSKLDLSSLFSYTKLKATFIGDLHVPTITPKNFREFDLTSKNDLASRFDAGFTHNTFFEMDQAIKNDMAKLPQPQQEAIVRRNETAKELVLNQVQRNVEERYKLMFDEMTYRRKK
jgi:hypothetical protein